MVECKAALLRKNHSQLRVLGARMSDLQSVDVMVYAVHGQMEASGRGVAAVDEMSQTLGMDRRD
tara:strand:- start:13483 stop:13674 length:192 start_codon:yes stop_codon:yes gene_type:complete